MAFCHTCQRSFHALGIMRHRAMHRDKREDCDISMKSGRFLYRYGETGKETDNEPQTD